jgi:hypothetical protein
LIVGLKNAIVWIAKNVTETLMTPNPIANWNESLRVVEAALLKLRVSSPSEGDAFQRRTCDAA